MLNFIKKAGSIWSFVAIMLVSASLSAQDLPASIKLTQSENFDAAKAAYEKLIAAQPTNGDNYFYLGENYISSFFADTISVALAEVTGPAKAAFQKGTEVDPENPLCYVGLAKIALMTRDTAAARYLKEAFGKLPSKTNKTSTVSIEKQALTYAKAAEAMIQSKLKTVAKALEMVQKAAELDPKNPEIFLIWGDVYMENNEGSLAKAKYNISQELNPNSPAAKLRVGKLWVRARNWADAISSYNEAIAIDPNFAPAYVELGAIYMRANQPAKAKEYFEKYLALSSNIGAKIKYLSVLLELKDYVTAITIALEIQKIDPSRNDINRALAYCYFETKAYPKALESMEIFFKNANPEKVINSDYVYYGNILQKNGKDSLAVEQFKLALEKNPENYDLYTNIAEGYKGMKKTALAVEWYNKKKAAGKMVISDYYRLGMLYYNIAVVSTLPEDWKNADTTFAEVAKLKPDYMQGKAYLWRGRCNSSLDLEGTLGLANPHYLNYIQYAKVDSVKNAKELVEAYDYFQFYYLKQKDYCNAKLYVERILWTDPEGKFADIPKFKDLLLDYTKNCKP
jgi:tetratricopeptide (TPR) repeat protein